MLERLLAQCGAGSIDRTLHIAAAWTSHKDPLPGLAINVMAQYDRSHGFVEVTELIMILRKRVGRRTTVSHDTAMQAICWWLSHECAECHGLKHLKLPDSPTLEEALCPSCHGLGIRPHPLTSAGYAQCLTLLDSAYDWARQVGNCMPMALEARITTEVA
jgi:hypothetical protein